MSADHAARQTTVRKGGERPGRDWTGTDSADLQERIHALVDDLMRGVLDAFVMASPAEIAELMRIVGNRREWDGTSWRFERAVKAAANGAAPTPAADRSKLEDVPSAPPGRDPRSSPELRTPPPHKRNAAQRAAGRDSSQRTFPSFEEQEGARRDSRSTLGSHDPFDITSPSELLASAGSRTSSSEVLDRIAASFDRTVAPVGAAPFTSATPAPAAKPPGPDVSPPNLPATPPKREPANSPVAAVDQETESERRPRVVLREGERLLSATGSGVVIRRARR